MPMISKVFLQAIVLLAMTALVSCAQERQANSSSDKSPRATPVITIYAVLDGDTIVTTTPTPTTSTSTTATTTTTMAPTTTTTTTTVSGDYNAPCPTDMTYFRGSCYGVGHSKVTWSDAQTVCEMIGASLAVMDSEVENAYFKVIAKDHNFDITWIGAVSPLLYPSEIQSDDGFVWIGTHGKILPLKGQPGFQDWGSYQPNMNGEGCVAVWSGDFFRWHDVYCDQKHNYICELQPTMND